MTSLDARQGGDTSESTVLDLSTCINAYGPSPSVEEFLSEGGLNHLIHRHPFRAASDLGLFYGSYIGCNPSNLVAVRGASEGIFLLASLFGDERVALPGPTYTEFLRYFSKPQIISARTNAHTLDQLETAALSAPVVAFSNPHNPTGSVIDVDQLVALYSRFPDVQFVVDESYADFVELGKPSTQPNVISLRSPSKFYGIAGVRVGVIHCTDKNLVDTLRTMQSTWPVSNLEVELAKRAMADEPWRQAIRRQLALDAQWLETELDKLEGIELIPGAQMHFRLVTGDVEMLNERLKTNGIAVRLLDESHGLDCTAMRITAPIETERKLLAAVLTS